MHSDVGFTYKSSRNIGNLSKKGSKPIYQWIIIKQSRTQS